MTSNKSSYVTTEPYLYTLIRYIEYNLIEARLSLKAGEYPFTLAYWEDGYSQIEIANYLGLSKSAISILVKNNKSGD